MLFNENLALLFWLNCWIPEFKNALEMFTGQVFTPEPRPGDPAALVVAEKNNFHWQGYELIRPRKISLWIGITADHLPSFFGSDGSPAEQKSLFKELLNQSISGAVHQINSKQPVPTESRDLSEVMPSVDTFDIQVQILIPELPGCSVWLIARNDETQTLLPSIPDPIQSPYDLERLSSLQLSVAVVLGKTKMSLRDVLKFTNGSVIELENISPESIDVIVHGQVVAKGEVVTVQGNYGVRIKELISRSERIHIGQMKKPSQQTESSPG